jgi:hypothetical protein
MSLSRTIKVLIALVVFCVATYFAALLVVWSGMGGSAYVAHLDLEQAELVTPDGVHPLVAKNIAHDDRDYSYTNPLQLIGGPEDLSIRFFPTAGSLQILYPREVWHLGERSISIGNRIDVEFPVGASFYQLNDDERLPFQVHVRDYNRHTPESLRSVYYRAEQPEPLTAYRIGYSGGSLYSDAVEMIEQHEDDVHRYHIAFLVADEPHAIDVAFRLRLETRWRGGGVPGMP